MHNRLSILYMILFILYINDIISQFSRKIEIPDNINESRFENTYLKQSVGCRFYAENLSKALFLRR